MDAIVNSDINKSLSMVTEEASRIHSLDPILIKILNEKIINLKNEMNEILIGRYKSNNLNELLQLVNQSSFYNDLVKVDFLSNIWPTFSETLRNPGIDIIQHILNNKNNKLISINGIIVVKDSLRFIALKNNLSMVRSFIQAGVVVTLVEDDTLIHNHPIELVYITRANSNAIAIDFTTRLDINRKYSFEIVTNNNRLEALKKTWNSFYSHLGNITLLTV